MSEPPELLDRLVPTSDGRSDWSDVLARRTRQRHKRALKLTAVAMTVIVALVPTAWAVGLFRGTPAPPAVKGELLHADDDEVAAVLGIMRKQLGVEAAKTHGVIELRTRQGPVRLWAAPVRGGGHCSFVQIGNAPRGEPPVGITNCEQGASPASAPPIEGGVDGSEDFGVHGLRILHGWIRRELLPSTPRSLTLSYTDGSQANIALVEDYFLALVPPKKYAHVLTVRGANGRNLGSVAVEETPSGRVSTGPVSHARAGPKLIELKLSNGSIARLYAQPHRGPCYDVEISDPSEPSARDAAHSCGDASGKVSFALQGFGGGPDAPAGVLLAGYAQPDVVRIALKLADGGMLPVPITDAYILLELPKRLQPRAIISYDSSGHELESQLIVPSP